MRGGRKKYENTILTFLMVFTPLMFGGVHVWVYSITALMSLLLFDIHFLFRARPLSPVYRKDTARKVFTRPESISIILFFLICVVYVIPLPAALVRSVSPELARLRDVYAFDPLYRQTLSAYSRDSLNYLIKLAGYIMVYFVVISSLTEKDQRPEGPKPRSVYPAFIMFASVMGVLSILFHSFVDFNLHIPANSLYFTILLAMITVLGAKNTAINYVFMGRLVNSIVMIGFCTALFGIIQYFGWNGKMFWIIKKPGSNFGPFVCYNNFAGFIEMASFMAIGLFYAGIFTSPLRHMKRLKDKVIWFSSPEANKTILYLFSSVVMAGALFLSRSRGGIISFSLAFAVFASVCVVIGPRTRKTKLFILGFSVLGLFAAMIIWLGPEATLNRFRQLGVMIQDIIEGRESMYLLRPLMWIDTVKIIARFPLVGVGLGAYSNIFIIERSFSASWGFLLYAHQDYLHLLAEMGLVGAVYLALFFVWYIRKFRFCLRRLHEGAENLERY